MKNEKKKCIVPSFEPPFLLGRFSRVCAFVYNQAPVEKGKKQSINGYRRQVFLKKRKKKKQVRQHFFFVSFIFFKFWFLSDLD